MKESYLSLLVFTLSLILIGQSHAQLFTQNFNSSSALSDYYNSSPGTNQFRLISTTGEGASISVSNNALVMTRLSSSSNIAYAERNLDFSATPSGLKFQFMFSVSGNSASVTNALVIYVGSNVANASAVPTIANCYARLAIGFTSNNGEFRIRDITNTTTGLNTYSGTQIITWYLNNTGSDKTYTSPNTTIETLGNDQADIWVGTTKEFSGINIDSPTQTIARFKFLVNNWANDNTIITFDDLLIENESALPVELTSFTANVNDNIVQLNWETATEVNNYGFIVERKMEDGKGKMEGEKIGFVNGYGNSNSPKYYSFTDKPFGGSIFKYRLKQIDFDGKYEYSNELSVILENIYQYKLSQNFPNPFNPITKLNYTIPQKTNVKITVYDLVGREVITLTNKEHEKGIYQIEFNGSKLSSGTYFYKLDAGIFSEIKKFILIK